MILQLKRKRKKRGLHFINQHQPPPPNFLFIVDFLLYFLPPLFFLLFLLLILYLTIKLHCSSILSPNLHAHCDTLKPFLNPLLFFTVNRHTHRVHHHTLYQFSKENSPVPEFYLATTFTYLYLYHHSFYRKQDRTVCKKFS